MLFELNEMAILNENVTKGLPNNVGDCVTVARYRDAGSYQYDVKLPSGDIAFVRESEINKLTTEQEELVKYLYRGNTVLYIPTNDEVDILKVDFLHNQVEVIFVDSSEVVPFEKLTKIEKGNDMVEENYKFKIGDTVKVIVEDDIFTGKEGEIVDTYKVYNSKNGYDVSFGVKDETFCFNEEELDFHIKECQTTDNKNRTDLHRDVIEEIHNTFKIKNADYGNSFGEQYEEYGLLSAVIRLDDKMRRLKQLMKQDAQVKDENIRDTVLDLANYAIMTVMEMDK